MYFGAFALETNFPRRTVTVIRTTGITAVIFDTIVGTFALDFFDIPDHHAFGVAIPIGVHALFGREHVGAGAGGSSFASLAFFTAVRFGHSSVTGFAVGAAGGGFAGVGGCVTGFIFGCIAIGIGQTSYTSAAGGVAFFARCAGGTIGVAGTFGGPGDTIAFGGITYRCGSGTGGICGTRSHGLTETFGGIACRGYTFVGAGTIGSFGWIAISVTGVALGMTTRIGHACAFGGITSTAFGGGGVAGITWITTSETIHSTIIIAFSAVTDFFGSAVRVGGASRTGYTFAGGCVAFLT